MASLTLFVLTLSFSITGIGVVLLIAASISGVPERQPLRVREELELELDRLQGAPPLDPPLPL